jgi:basic amino acid/polyamine antiporter, APA family
VAIAAVGVAPIETLTGSDAPLAAGLREGAGIAWAGGCWLSVR